MQKKVAFLSSGENCTVFRRTPPKLSQSAFWKLSKPCWAGATPFGAEAVGRSFSKLIGIFMALLFQCAAPRIKLGLTSQTIQKLVGRHRRKSPAYSSTDSLHHFSRAARVRGPENKNGKKKNHLHKSPDCARKRGK